MNAHDPNTPLERQIGDVLKTQPPMKAPSTLEARVLDEIERRTRSPWWHQSFVHWPLAARLVFIASCVGAAWLSVDVFAWAGSELKPVHSIIVAASDVSTTLLNLIPQHWLAAAVGVAAALNAALFGFGAAAYRTLCK